MVKMLTAVSPLDWCLSRYLLEETQVFFECIIDHLGLPYHPQINQHRRLVLSQYDYRHSRMLDVGLQT